MNDIVTRLRAAGCVFAEDEASLLTAAASSPSDLESMVDRRVGGEPLEQIVGWAEFCGLRIAVEPTVFVPRRRTEFLVQQASALVSPGGVVVDLCCGSGAIGVATVAAMSEFELYAADIDIAAVQCARRNVEPVGGQVFQGDLYDALPARIRGRVGVLLVNAPYVPTEDIGMMPPEARDHEARVALDGGSDGLEDHTGGSSQGRVDVASARRGMGAHRDQRSPGGLHRAFARRRRPDRSGRALRGGLRHRRPRPAAAQLRFRRGPVSASRSIVTSWPPTMPV